MKNASWLCGELGNGIGAFSAYPFARTILAPTRIAIDRSLAAQAAEMQVDGETRFETAVSSCVGGETGLWFHAGWHDQASLELLDVKKGSAPLTRRVLKNLDDKQPNENGDMVSGFASIDSDWVLLYRLSRERRTLSSEIRAAAAALADAVHRRIEEARE